MSSELQELQDSAQELQDSVRELAELLRDPQALLVLVGLVIFFVSLPFWFRARRTIGLRGENILAEAVANGCMITGHLINYKIIRGDPSERVLRRRRARYIATYSYERGGKFFKYKYHGGRTKPPETIKLYYSPRRPQKVFDDGIRYQRGVKYLLWALYPATGWFMVPAVLLLVYSI